MRQISEIQTELAALTAERERIDARLAEVRAEAQAAIEGLQQLLGASPPAVPRKERREPERDLTDADIYGDRDEDDGTSAADFRAELAALRAHNVEKRRRLS